MASTNRFKQLIEKSVTPLLQLLLGLGLAYLLLQKVALDIHIHQPGLAISVAVTLKARENAYTYSFNLPPLHESAWQDSTQEST